MLGRKIPIGTIIKWTDAPNSWDIVISEQQARIINNAGVDKVITEYKSRDTHLNFLTEFQNSFYLYSTSGSINAEKIIYPTKLLRLIYE